MSKIRKNQPKKRLASMIR